MCRPPSLIYSFILATPDNGTSTLVAMIPKSRFCVSGIHAFMGTSFLVVQVHIAGNHYLTPACIAWLFLFSLSAYLLLSLDVLTTGWSSAAFPHPLSSSSLHCFWTLCALYIQSDSCFPQCQQLPPTALERTLHLCCQQKNFLRLSTILQHTKRETTMLLTKRSQVHGHSPVCFAWPP